jgi:hypothetical protein
MCFLLAFLEHLGIIDNALELIGIGCWVGGAFHLRFEHEH